MTEKKAKHPWRGWRPGSSKEYVPDDPRFNPMHPPKGYPKELLEDEWRYDSLTTEELEDGGTKYILKRTARDD